ncbi:MAG: HPP family protein, partial [Dehalococcoidales bacterium]|nr:HPP family protein [Dehalococcoidales bacterium]
LYSISVTGRGRAVEVIDKSFIQKPKNYIIQSLMALAVLLIILSFVEVLTEAAIVAALGASTFIVFAMPRSITARPRRLIGGPRHRRLRLFPADGSIHLAFCYRFGYC